MTITHIMRTFADHQLYLVNLHGDQFSVMVTASASLADAWVVGVENSSIENENGVEGRVVSMSVEVTHRDGNEVTLDTLLVCVDNRSMIYQLSQAQTVPTGLRQFLLSRRNKFVGFENGHDKSILQWSRYAVELGSTPIDLRMLLMRYYVQVSFCSQERIYEALLGYPDVTFRVDVSMFTDWGAQTLSADQVLHSSLEARCNFLLAQHMHLCGYI